MSQMWEIYRNFKTSIINILSKGSSGKGYNMYEQMGAGGNSREIKQKESNTRARNKKEHQRLIH